MSASHVIKHDVVLRYLYEFLYESGYHDTLRALQAESKVPYNVIHVKPESLSTSSSGNPPAADKKKKKRAGVFAFAEASERGLEVAVLDGNWSEVLHGYVDGLLLPEEVRANLYELIFEEMLTLHHLHTAASAFLMNGPIFQDMKKDAPARYIRLEKMLEAAHRDAATTEGKTSTTTEIRERRAAVLQQLRSAISFSSEAATGRLPAALALVESQTTRFSGPTASKRPREEQSTSAAVEASSGGAKGHDGWTDVFLQYPLRAPSVIQRRLPYTAEKAVCCCASAAAGDQFMWLVGRADGVVDFVAAADGKLLGSTSKHSEGVLCMAVDSSAGTSGPVWAAVGYRDGSVKIFNCESRKLVRRFAHVHQMGVTTVQFGGPVDTPNLQGHCSMLLTGSFDGCLQVLSIATGESLHTVANAHHSAFIHSIAPLLRCPTAEVSTTPLVYYYTSAGNDGLLSVWILQEAPEDGVEQEGRSKWSLQRMQAGLPLGQLHHELRGAVPVEVVALSSPPDALLPPSVEEEAVTCEILLLTRSAVACLLRIQVTPQPHRTYAVAIEALCIISTPHPLRSAVTHVQKVVSLSVPLITIYAADVEGTIYLYNVEMKWRSEEGWKDFGGCMKVTEATDQSSAVIVDVGKAVKDLSLAGSWPLTAHQPSGLVAYAPSTSNMYEVT